MTSDNNSGGWLIGQWVRSQTPSPTGTEQTARAGGWACLACLASALPGCWVFCSSSLVEIQLEASEADSIDCGGGGLGWGWALAWALAWTRPNCRYATPPQFTPWPCRGARPERGVGGGSLPLPPRLEAG